MSVPPTHSIKHPVTGQDIHYNGVIGVDGRSTLCLLSEKGIRWGEVWLDELPEHISKHLIATHILPDRPTVQSSQTPTDWARTSFYWAIAAALVVSALVYF